jgi:hypothetical protein
MNRGRITQTVLTSSVIGTVGSVGLAVITALTVTQAQQISFIMGAVGTILGAVVGIGLTLSERLDEIEKQRIEAADLRALVDMPEVEREFVAAIRNLKKIRDLEGAYARIFWGHGLGTLQESTGQLTVLAGGRFTCSSLQEIYFVREALMCTRSEVCAVAARGPGWWLKPEADAYWRVYGEAAGRISITRIFLGDPVVNPDLRAILNRHSGLGMRTYWIAAELVPDALKQPIVVFDQGLLHRSFMGRSIDEEQEVEFTTDARAVVRARTNFGVIMSLEGVHEWVPTPA